MYHVARSMLCRKSCILSYKDGRGHLEASMFPFEPYQLLAIAPCFVCKLFDPNMSNLPVPTPILDDIRKLCCLPKIKPQNFKELRNYLDSLSIFAGRNPLVSVYGSYILQVCS